MRQSKLRGSCWWRCSHNCHMTLFWDPSSKLLKCTWKQHNQILIFNIHIHLFFRLQNCILFLSSHAWNLLFLAMLFRLFPQSFWNILLHCLPAGGSWVFELENHSQSVLHLFEISSIQDFLFHVAWLYMKKVPWNMQMVVNWHSSFPFLVSCLLSLRWNLSMFCSREHK